MTPLEAAQAIIDARARATAGDWQSTNFNRGVIIQTDDGKPIFDLVPHENGVLSEHHVNCLIYDLDFIALTANHAAAVAQAYIDAMQDNARLRAARAAGVQEVVEAMGDDSNG